MTLGNSRILVIDDDPEIWKVYQAVLAPEQDADGSSGRQIVRLLNRDRQLDPTPRFQLRFAGQGRDGFEAIQGSLPDRPFAVVFIDVRMPPGWDGMETAARIRRVDPHIEIVIVTAYSDRSRDEIVEAVGAPHKLLFLRKPFDPEELTQMALSLTEKWDLAKQEEAQRRELQTVLMTTPAAIFTVDVNRCITSWNPAAEQMIGYTSEDVVGKPCIFARLSGHPVCVDCSVGFESQGGRSCEITVTDKSGNKRILSKNISYIRNRAGNVVKAVESFWDITDMKEAEAALLHSESRFRALVETTSDWVWEMNADGCFTYCSPICEMIYAYRPEELLGRSLFDVLIPLDEVVRCRDVFDRCVREVSSFQGIERRSLRKDGRVIHIESSGAPVIGEGGKVAGFRGIDRDITERRKNEEERLKLEEQYRQSQKMEALGTLAGGIAHDLNNILTPIMGHAQLSLLKAGPNSPVYNNLRDIVRSSEKAADLLHQILAFSRKQVLVTRTLDLNRLIEDFAKMLRRLIREDIEVKLDLAQGLWMIDADSSQMQQILINLVVNARDAIAESGEVVIRTRNEVVAENGLFDVDHKPLKGSYMVLSVSDNGIGMDSATLARIFDPFFTTKEAGKGTGLGLSTVYGIVKQHGGHIRVKTVPGFGTEFHIYFKRTEQKVELEGKSEGALVKGGKETILLAEDHAEVRMVVSSALEHFGYQVIVASSGAEAVKLFRKCNGKIDLLLTDIIMPGFGGKAVAEALRAQRPDLPIIFMSGQPFDVVPGELLKGERAVFLQKPFKPQEVARKVREILDKRSRKPVAP